jgi:hypothetical protein
MKSNHTITGTTKFVIIALVVWLALVWFLGAHGAFARPTGTPPLPILLGVMAPIIAFLSAYRFSLGFREFVLTLDLRLGAGIQAWRFVGFGFLALYAQGVLPAAFALPAGLGDIAVGVTAPWVILTLIRRPNFAASRLFVAWNLFGILDLMVAVSGGGLNMLMARGIPREITTRPMAEMPLVLIPAYLVPLFLMLHLSALFQVRRRLCDLRDRDTRAALSTALPADAH